MEIMLFYDRLPSDVNYIYCNANNNYFILFLQGLIIINQFCYFILYYILILYMYFYLLH